MLLVVPVAAVKGLQSGCSCVPAGVLPYTAGQVGRRTIRSGSECVGRQLEVGWVHLREVSRVIESSFRRGSPSSLSDSQRMKIGVSWTQHTGSLRGLQSLILPP